MKTTSCGMSLKAITISHVLDYQPKKKDLLAFGDSGTNAAWKSIKKATYTTLLTNGKLNTYLTDIDSQAQERFETLTEQMKQAQGI